MKLIVGLGNPGARYAHTRHNVGFDVVDRLAAQLGETAAVAMSGSELWRGVDRGTDRDDGDMDGGDGGGDQEYLLLKPGEYMNRSGGPVRRVAEHFDLVPQDVLVVYDDLDLSPGRLRVRAKGSAGGHRGLQDISEQFSPLVQRLRIGIGRPGGGAVPGEERVPVEEYVLARFDEAQQELMEQTIKRAAEAVVCWRKNGVVATANQFNGTSADSDDA